MKRFWKLVRLTIITVASMVVLWFALVENVVWCKRLFVFYSWFALIMTFLVTATFKHLKDVEKLMSKTYRNGEHFPKWLDGVVYAYKIILCVAFGHVGLGIMWLFIYLFDICLREWSMEKPTAKP